MATQTLQRIDTEVAPPDRYRFTREEYYRLADAGIIEYGKRIELIEGVIVPMSPIGGSHGLCVDYLNLLLASSVGLKAWVRGQNPVWPKERTELIPDVTIATRPPWRWDHPGPAETLLVIEVSDSTLARDRYAKLSLYAEANFREVWIVDLVNRVVTSYLEPQQGSYTAVTRFVPGGTISSVLSSTLTITLDVNDIFGFEQYETAPAE